MRRMKIGVATLTLVILVSLVLSGLVLAKPSFSQKDFDEDEYVSDEIIVKYKGDDKPFRLIKLPAGKSIKEAEQEFEMEEEVEYAEPNYIAHAFLVPNDPYYGYQWHLDNSVYGGIQTEAAWDISSGSGITVAVIDTGIAYEDYGRGWRKYKQAPDLTETCFVDGYDFVNDDSHPNDDNSHGTHVAGTIAQSTDNEKGVAGVAFDTCLMPVKVLDRYGRGTYADVASGIYFAVDSGAQVINLSLGGSADAQVLKEAVAYAYNNGVTVVAAAGNDSSSLIAYPAAYNDYVIAVGATRYDETLAYYSNYGPDLDLVAPGGDLYVDQNNDGYGDGVLQNTFNPNTKNTKDFGYWFFQGTSMAAPHVSGLAALVLTNGNAITPDEVRTALETTAEDLGTTGWDSTYGWGLVDAALALSWTAGPPAPVDSPPSVSITSPLNGATVSGLVTISATASDDIGVTQVDFYADGGLLGSDLVVPYSWTWDSATVLDGLHTLTATAIDTGLQQTSDSISVLVDNVNDLPIANAGPDQSAYLGQTVNFDASGSSDPDGTIVSYDWDFGDGTAGIGLTTTHIYGAIGSYTVTLIVTDNGGATSSDTALVQVSEAPVGGLKIVSVSARDTYSGKKVDVEAVIENLESADIEIDAVISVEIVGLSGARDQTSETFGPGDIITVELNPRIPRDAIPGTYTALVTVIWDSSQDSGSDTFLVESRSSGRSEED